MVALAIVILAISIGLWYSHKKGDVASNERWHGLFRHVVDSILNYYHGNSTRLFMLALRAIIAISGVSAVYPFVRAAFEYNELNGYWEVYFELQFDAVSLTLQIVSIVAVLIIVILYCYVNQKNKISAEEVKEDIEELKRIGIENQAISQQNAEKLTELLSRPDMKGSSDTIRRLLPKFKEDINTLKLSSAYDHLKDINDELKRVAETEYALRAHVQYYMGLCARYKKAGDCVKHYVVAYDLMRQSGEAIPEVYEGMIYVSCKLKTEEEAHQYAEELKRISSTDFWVVVPNLVYAKDINQALGNISGEFNKTLALSNAIVIGLKCAQPNFGVDIDTYRYFNLSELTIDNIPLWVLDMQVAANRFLYNWHMYEDIRYVKNKYAGDLFSISDAYLKELESKDDIVNIVPDIVFLHAFTGYVLDRNEAWLAIMANERENVHLKDVYFLAYAIMLLDKKRIREASELLKEFGDNPPAEILSLRLLLAFQTPNVEEIIDPVRIAVEQNILLPDLFLPNFMTVIYYFFDEVKQYASLLNIQSPSSKDFVNTYVAFREGKEIDVVSLKEQEISYFLYPYLAEIYEAKLNLDAAIELMEKCTDRKVLDFRTERLISYYSKDQKYAVQLYHLLKELRTSGVLEKRFLWREMTMADSIKDTANAMEVSQLYIKQFPEDATGLLFYVKILRDLGKTDEIKSYKVRFKNADLIPNNVKILVDIYLGIGEAQFALDYLYQEIKITEDQTLLDYYYTIHLNPEVEKIISEENTIVQLGDLTTIKIGEEEQGVEVKPGSVYAVLEGNKIGDEVSISIQGRPQNATIIASKNKYFRMLLKAQESIRMNQSTNIRMFDLNDFNFKEDPIGALKQMIGAPDDAENIEAAKRLNYKQGTYSLGNFIRESDEIASAYNLIFDRRDIVYTMSNVFYDAITNSKELLKYEVVLDLTSLIVLNEIERRYKIQFAKKFIIPKSLQSLLYETANKVERDKQSLLYQSVIDTITFDYVDKGKTTLWNVIQNLQDWIERNCEVKIVEEKLKYDKGDDKRQIYNLAMDSILLTSQGRVLLTEDWCWAKTMLEKCPSMSVYNWLHLSEYNIEHDYAEFMLNCGNLGYALSVEYIQKQFELNKDNQSNLLSNCMLSIEIDPTNYRAMLDAGYAILQGDTLEETRTKVTEMFISVMDILTPKSAYLLCYHESLNHRNEAYLRCLGDAFKASHPDFLKNMLDNANFTVYDQPNHRQNFA